MTEKVTWHTFERSENMVNVVISGSHQMCPPSSHANEKLSGPYATNTRRALDCPLHHLAPSKL